MITSNTTTPPQGTAGQTSGKPRETITAALFAKYVRYYAPSQKAESGDELMEMARRARAAARQGTREYNKEDAKADKNDTDSAKAAEKDKAVDAASQSEIDAAKGAEMLANQAERTAEDKAEDAAGAFAAALGAADPGAQLLDTAARAAELAREGSRFYDRRDLSDQSGGGTTLWAMTLSELRAQRELYGAQAASLAAERRARLLTLGVR